MAHPDESTNAGREAALAPRWHTALLVFVIASVATIGLVFMPHAPPTAAPRARVWTLYLPLIVVQCALLVYVARVGRRTNALGALLGKRWDGVPRAAGDMGIAAVGWIVVHAIESAWLRVTAAAEPSSVTAMLPHSVQERLTWAILAAVVGFSEEVVYRGYLQTQLKAFTRSAPAAIALQALLFGLAHGDQGITAIPRIALYGVLFGIVAHARSSLLPTILCHIAIDLTSGLGLGR